MSALIVALHRAELLEAHDPLSFLKWFLWQGLILLRHREGSTNSIPHLLFFPCNVMEQRRWQVGVSFVCTRVCLQHNYFVWMQ
jgi:hypothetical protein